MERQVNFEEEDMFLDDNDEYLLALAIGPNYLEPSVPENWEEQQDEEKLKEETEMESVEEEEELWHGLETEAEYLAGLARGPTYLEPSPPEDWEMDCKGNGVGIISNWTPADIAKCHRRWI